MANEDQREELEALKSIYENEFTDISNDPPCFMVKLPDLQLPGALSLKFTLPTKYPDVRPVIEIPMRNQVLSTESHQQLLSLLNEKDLDKQEINDTEIKSIKLEEPKLSGGRWQYVIGLVGKPSAGKSTFFNAATTLDLAKTGAHPFTTIEPNIGKAFFSIPCPCSNQSIKCNAVHGHDFRGKRYLPILLKDVAGLVPGAWEGKGRGNRFLNDLLDADVLIHIIDASGTTNEKGEETTDYDPANDVHWLKAELHQWIYQNVWSKWDNIVKRPQKLIDMFTGYHANKATIYAALHNAGINESELSKIKTWDSKVLHQIVDSFLNIRFPTLLVLNKADKESSTDIISRLSAEFGDGYTIPVSAERECFLQRMVKEGQIKYDRGSDQITPLECPSTILTELKRIENDIFKRYRSTNVQNALCQAISLREPVYAFPVRCLDSFQSIGKSHTEKGQILRDCIMLKPGTTVEEFHNALCHYPVSLLSGDFVRAETIQADGLKRPVKKDEVISNSNNILKIMTTRRSS
ncbi:uncharacterized protein LOC133176957 isoform X2 [Saccostrea echinata]|uniref:uncharacterized protein LOC133176957 isoform X2 n=1 Tax=Saccostrea echinata TaxID=191078 RepID=UPI002A821B83|nr:uncharacterized protein LOC133176957 isoform X2 [Saccostrea echinata]